MTIIHVPSFVTFKRDGWDRQIQIRDVKSIYCNEMEAYGVLDPMVCWYLDMGLFETLEIILGEELDLQFVD